MKKWKISASSIIVPVLIVAQYILTFFIYKLTAVKALQWAGWAIWVLSLIFGIAPIFILRQRGGVPKGNSYVKTTCLVDTSLYAIVRHPQYLGGILFSLALMLLSPHGLVILLGIVCIVLLYLDIQAADQEGIEKFGDEYRQYMQRVPQMNFLLGAYRIMKAKKPVEQ